MVNLSELRRGNYLCFISQFTNQNTIGKVFEIRNDSVDIKMNNRRIENVGYMSANPIELNEEVFETCGFTQKGSAFELYKSSLHLIKSYDGWQMQQGTGYVGKRVLHNLHEIQNLYFALIGEEIEIKGFDD